MIFLVTATETLVSVVEIFGKRCSLNLLFVFHYSHGVTQWKENSSLVCLDM